jgi:hypothetical protein
VSGKGLVALWARLLGNLYSIAWVAIYKVCECYEYLLVILSI